MSWKESSTRRRIAPGRWRVALTLLLLASSMLLLPAHAGQAKSGSAVNGDAPGDGYIGSQACSQCHADVYRRFSQTSMGRSMSPVTPAVLDKTPSSYTNEKLNRRFEVYSKDANLYQSESGIGSDGKESFKTDSRVEWIVGAGVNGFGAILRKNNFQIGRAHV